MTTYFVITWVMMFTSSLKRFGKRLTTKVTQMAEARESKLTLPVMLTEPDVDDIWEQDYMREYFPIFTEAR